MVMNRWEGVIVFLLLLILFGATWGVISHIEEQAKAGVGKSLRTALQTSYTAVLNHLDGQKNAALVWAHNADLLNYVSGLQAQDRDVDTLIHSDEQQKLRALLRPILGVVGYRGFFIVANDNLNLASSRDGNVGAVNLLTRQHGFLERVRAGETLVSLPQRSDVPLKDSSGRLTDGLATMFVATPLIDNAGEVMAILAFRLEPEDTFFQIFKHGRFGDSGETYAFNNRGLLISDSRFTETLVQIGLLSAGSHAEFEIQIRDPGVNLLAGLKPALPHLEQPLTRMALSATRGESAESLEGYRDYRGVPVVGAWLWDENYHFGIATEVDVEEAFDTFYDMRFALFLYLLLSMAALIALALLSSSSRKKIAEKEAQYHESISISSQGYWLLDSQARMLEVNQAFCTMLGRKSAELLGKRPSEFSSDAGQKILLGQLGSMSTSPRRRYELILLNKQNESVYVDVHANTLRDSQGEITGAVAFITDISERKEVEQTLAEKARELDFQKYALDQHAIVSIADIKGNISYANEKFCEISGYSLEELLGNNHRIVGSGLHSQDFFSQMWRTIAQGDVWRGNIRNLKKGGGYYWVNATIVPSLDERGKPFQYVAIRTDITERIRAEEQLIESKERLSAAIENVPGGFLMVDKTGCITLFNSKFIGLYPVMQDHLFYGECFDEFIRTGAKRGLYPAAHGRIDEWVEERLKKHRSKEICFEERLADGRWLSIAIKEMPDGSRVGIHLDISALKQATEAANQASKAKSQFLSSMSHELRTPMNAILGFGQMLEFNPEEPLSVHQKECVDHITKGGQHLLLLINDILDLAQIETGKVELSIEDVLPSEVFEECLPLVAVMAKARAIEIIPPRAENIPRVRADHVRLKQVLINLMSNAVKYNHQGGTLSVNFEERPNRQLRIAVNDTGPGIPKDKQALLFKAFNRLGAEATAVEGTGIGLVVCKELVELMRGSMGMESELGRGTTFWIELPLAERTQVEHIAVNTAIAQATKVLPGIRGTVLYVEDNPDNVALMKLIVSHVDGLSMLTANNAGRGVELALSEQPDLIILDINLPGMNGIEALTQLHGDERTQHIPVLAMSAAATKRDIDKGLAAGFLHYLTKPIDISEVVKTIKAVLEDDK